MRKHKNLTPDERKAELRRILRCKCKRLSDEVIDDIIAQINIKRPYCVKVVCCPVKFLNVVTAEFIGTNQTKRCSISIPLCGSFTAGHFTKSDSGQHCSPGSMNQNGPAAAVTLCLKEHGSCVALTHSLVIYEPK